MLFFLNVMHIFFKKIAVFHSHDKMKAAFHSRDNSEYVQEISIKNCRQTHGTERHQQDKPSIATSSLFPIKMIVFHR